MSDTDEGNDQKKGADFPRQMPEAPGFETTNAQNVYGVYSIPINTLHRPAAKSVFDGRVYEPQTIEFMRSNHHGKDIIHAGTFFGDFLPGLSSGMSSAGLVWAFEPTPESYWCARETIRLNRIENVILRNAALSSTRGSLTMRVKSKDGLATGGASRVVKRQPDGDTFVSVDSVRIDDAVPENRPIGILQLDLEGHEGDALRGATKTIARSRPALIIENQFEAGWLHSILNVEYRLAGRLHGNGLFVAA